MFVRLLSEIYVCTTVAGVIDFTFSKCHLERQTFRRTICVQCGLTCQLQGYASIVGHIDLRAGVCVSVVAYWLVQDVGQNNA